MTGDAIDLRFLIGWYEKLRKDKIKPWERRPDTASARKRRRANGPLRDFLDRRGRHGKAADEPGENGSE